MFLFIWNSTNSHVTVSLHEVAQAMLTLNLNALRVTDRQLRRCPWRAQSCETRYRGGDDFLFIRQSPPRRGIISIRADADLFARSVLV